MRYAGWNQSKIARAERVHLLTDLDRDAAFQNIEALFERMQVRCNESAGVEKADAGAHMNGSHGAIDIGGAPETGAVLPVKLGRLRGGWVDLGDSVHGVVIYYGS